MAPKLKVFQAHLGFYDTVVAAPSQPAALKTWGSRQNLFRDGLASLASDPKAIAAATAKPGVVLRRPAGSQVPFSETPALPQVPNLAKKPTVAKNRGPAPVPKKDKPKPPDRTALDRAEGALEDLKREERAALAAIQERKKALAEEERRTHSQFNKRRGEAETARANARKSYQKARRSS